MIKLLSVLFFVLSIQIYGMELIDTSSTQQPDRFNALPDEIIIHIAKANSNIARLIFQDYNLSNVSKRFFDLLQDFRPQYSLLTPFCIKNNILYVQFPHENCLRATQEFCLNNELQSPYKNEFKDLVASQIVLHNSYWENVYLVLINPETEDLNSDRITTIQKLKPTILPSYRCRAKQNVKKLLLPNQNDTEVVVEQKKNALTEYGLENFYRIPYLMEFNSKQEEIATALTNTPTIMFDNIDYCSFISNKEKYKSIWTWIKNKKILFKLLKHKSPDLAKHQLFNSCNVNVVNAKGDTPLHIAVENNDEAFVQLLLDKKADTNILKENRQSPLYTSIYSSKNIKISALLLEHKADPNINSNNPNPEPLLINAVKNNTELAKLLVTHKANIDTTDLYNNTALHTTLMYTKRLELTNLLIDSKANLNNTNNEGRTPLHLASLSIKNTETIEKLINAKADINTQDENGYTPLHLTVLCSNPVATEILINAYANINLHDNKNKTPLNIALDQANKPSACKLIAAGAQAHNIHWPSWLRLYNYWIQSLFFSCNTNSINLIQRITALPQIIWSKFFNRKIDKQS